MQTTTSQHDKLQHCAPAIGQAACSPIGEASTASLSVSDCSSTSSAARFFLTDSTLENFSVATSKANQSNHRNQQYSVIALTDDTGAIVERYSYSAYGEPAFFDGSGTLLSPQSSSLSNRYTYTGREYDSVIRLYHYRERMYDSQLGRFLGRDPIGFEGGGHNTYAYVSNGALTLIDPFGLKSCVARKELLRTGGKFDIGKVVSFDIYKEISIEGKECIVDCDWKCKRSSSGLEFTGTYTSTLKAKFSAKLGAIPVPWVPIAQFELRMFGGGEGGYSGLLSYNTCTGSRRETGCGYIQLTGGFEGCAKPRFLSYPRVCLKGDAYYRRRWCLDGKDESCTGLRVTVSMCWTEYRCRELTLYEFSTCTTGGGH